MRGATLAVNSNGGMLSTRDSLFADNVDLSPTSTAAGIVATGGSLMINTTTFKRHQGTDAAAVSVAGTAVMIQHSVFEKNTGSTHGALFANAVSFMVMMTVFKDNRATAGTGGAVFFDYNSNTPQIHRCTFTNNTALFAGGAVFMAADFEFHHAHFSKNSAAAGGALALTNLVNDVSGSLMLVEFHDNTAWQEDRTQVHGGGALLLLATAKSIVHVHDCKFVRSHSNSSGGAIRIAGGECHVNGGSFHNNSCEVHGGAAFADGPTASLNMMNAYFSFNVANDFGGTVAFNDGDAELSDAPWNSLFNTTMQDSIGFHGGCVSVASKLVFMKNVTLLRCIAEDDGGGILIADDGMRCVDPVKKTAGTEAAIQGYVRMEDNEAEDYGGAIHITEGAPACEATFAPGSALQISPYMSGNEAELYGNRFATGPSTVVFTTSPATRAKKAEADGIDADENDISPKDLASSPYELPWLLCQETTFDVAIKVIDYFGQQTVGLEEATATLASAQSTLLIDHGEQSTDAHGEKSGSIVGKIELNRDATAKWEGIKLGSIVCISDRHPEECTNVTITATVRIPLEDHEARKEVGDEVKLVTLDDTPMPTDYCPAYVHAEESLGQGLVATAIIGVVVLAIAVIGAAVFWKRRLIREASPTLAMPALLLASVAFIATAWLLVGDPTEEACKATDALYDAGWALMTVFVVVRSRLLLYRYGAYATRDGAGGAGSGSSGHGHITTQRERRRASRKRRQQARRGRNNKSGKGNDGGESSTDGEKSGVTGGGTVGIWKNSSGSDGSGNESGGNHALDFGHEMAMKVLGVGPYRHKSDWQVMKVKENRPWLVVLFLALVFALVTIVIEISTLHHIRGGACGEVVPEVVEMLQRVFFVTAAARAVYSARSANERPFYEIRLLAFLTVVMIFGMFAEQVTFAAEEEGSDEGGSEANRTQVTQQALTAMILAIVAVVAFMFPKIALVLSRRDKRAFYVKEKAKLVRRIPFDELELDEEPLGTGSFGIVYSGNFLGNPCVAKMIHGTDEAYYGYAANTGTLAKTPGTANTGNLSGNDGKKKKTGLLGHLSGTLSGNSSHQSLQERIQRGAKSRGSKSGTNASNANSNATRGGTLDALEKERQALELAREDFIAEALQLSTIPQYSSIVAFFGVSEDPKHNLYLVSELVDGGPLHAYLQSGAEWTDRDLVNSATNVSGAIQVLHRNNTLHLDIACRNLLIFKVNPVAVKVCDFGLSHTLSQTEIEQGGLSADGRVFSARWYEPPRTGFFTKASDVFGYGSTLWEMMARRPPWPGVPHKTVVKAMTEGKVLKEPKPIAPMTENTIHKIYKLARSCWSPDIATRPTAAGITRMLRPVKKNLDSIAAEERERKLLAGELFDLNNKNGNDRVKDAHMEGFRTQLETYSARERVLQGGNNKGDTRGVYGALSEAVAVDRDPNYTKWKEAQQKQAKGAASNKNGKKKSSSQMKRQFEETKQVLKSAGLDNDDEASDDSAADSVADSFSGEQLSAVSMSDDLSSADLSELAEDDVDDEEYNGTRSIRFQFSEASEKAAQRAKEKDSGKSQLKSALKKSSSTAERPGDIALETVTAKETPDGSDKDTPNASAASSSEDASSSGSESSKEEQVDTDDDDSDHNGTSSEHPKKRGNEEQRDADEDSDHKGASRNHQKRSSRGTGGRGRSSHGEKKARRQHGSRNKKPGGSREHRAKKSRSRK
jgi:Protein tyrosine and serine/threonine kinase